MRALMCGSSWSWGYVQNAVILTASARVRKKRRQSLRTTTYFSLISSVLTTLTTHEYGGPERICSSQSRQPKSCQSSANVWCASEEWVIGIRAFCCMKSVRGFDLRGYDTSFWKIPFLRCWTKRVCRPSRISSFIFIIWSTSWRLR